MSWILCFFEEAKKADSITFGMAFVPFLNFETFDHSNRRADHTLDCIYERLYTLGAVDTIVPLAATVDSPNPEETTQGVQRNTVQDSTPDSQ